MAQTGHETHDYRNLKPLAEFEAVGCHVVGLLLTRRLKQRNHGEFGIETRILFVLRRVHRRIVGGNDEQAAVGSGESRVDESVGAYVHADMLHRNNSAFAAERHAKGLFYCGFFVA